jgi:hypothetical protein
VRGGIWSFQGKIPEERATQKWISGGLQRDPSRLQLTGDKDRCVTKLLRSGENQTHKSRGTILRAHTVLVSIHVPT